MKVQRMHDSQPVSQVGRILHAGKLMASIDAGILPVGERDLSSA
jgi:hypothetical protein